MPLNLFDQDKPAQVGKDQEMKVLSEMNEMQQFEDGLWSPGREWKGGEEGLKEIFPSGKPTVNG